MTRITFLIVLTFASARIHCQMSGSESLTNIQIYSGQFIVNGDKDTYYPVVFRFGNQDRINHLRIYRSYSEAGPNELSPTHKGGLTLEIDVNYGGWGGSSYDWRIMDLRQTYHETFAGATYAMHYMGFVVWLRGGGFVYHYESEYPSNLVVCYNSDLIYDYYDPAYPQYDANAPAPLTSIDRTTINSHILVRADNISAGNWILSSNSWPGTGGFTFNGNDVTFGIHSTSGQASLQIDGAFIQAEPQKNNYFAGRVGIGTNNPQNSLDVNGTIHAKEVKVDLTGWSDFVFKPTYKLKTLAEVEQYIKFYGHLPEIPSTSDVQQNGVNVGEMQARLLQKVEELTLYVIELKKENEKLKLENTPKMELLKSDVEELKNKLSIKNINQK